MTLDLFLNGTDGETVEFNPCGFNTSDLDKGNATFRRYHMGNLLHRIGEVLPRLLDGQDLIKESRALEQLCWRELGFAKQPIFDGDLPDFLKLDVNGLPIYLSVPTDPLDLAVLMAAIKPLSPPAKSCVGTNFEALARLMNFTPFEFQWLLWSYCMRRFGEAILPVILLRDATHITQVLALLCRAPLDVVREVVKSRRLYTWGFLNEFYADETIRLKLSGWLVVTYQFAEWIEKPFDSEADLLASLRTAQFPLPVPPTGFCSS
jgi:hypothetical protein